MYLGHRQYNTQPLNGGLAGLRAKSLRVRMLQGIYLRRCRASNVAVTSSFRRSKYPEIDCTHRCCAQLQWQTQALLRRVRLSSTHPRRMLLRPSSRHSIAQQSDVSCGSSIFVFYLSCGSYIWSTSLIGAHNHPLGYETMLTYRTVLTSAMPKSKVWRKSSTSSVNASTSASGSST